MEEKSTEGVLGENFKNVSGCIWNVIFKMNIRKTGWEMCGLELSDSR